MDACKLRHGLIETGVRGHKINRVKVYKTRMSEAKQLLQWYIHLYVP